MTPRAPHSGRGARQFDLEAFISADKGASQHPNVKVQFEFMPVHLYERFEHTHIYRPA